MAKEINIRCTAPDDVLMDDRWLPDPKLPCRGTGKVGPECGSCHWARVVEVGERHQPRVGKVKICPFRMLAHESDWKTINNAGTVTDLLRDGIGGWLMCIGEDCALWDEEQGGCVLLNLQFLRY